jgi:starch-binding outer membrane protein, SusD/RagB family
MPWINHSYGISNEKVQLPRLTAQATCDSIVALCDKAAVDLPFAIPAADLAQWDGRFTKASAMGLKARVLLFNASPLFNSSSSYLDGEASTQKLTWHGGYDANRWKKAMDAAHDLITLCESSGDYKIYHKAGNSFRQDFQDAYYRRGTGETLISIREQFKTDWYTFYGYSVWFGSICNEGIDIFPMTNGKPITDPTSGYDPQNPYVNRDPRMYETAVVNGDQYQGRTAELWIGGRERESVDGNNPTGYQQRKFVLDNDDATSIGSIMQWPFLRLPEIYLTYAEASNEFNNGPDAEAYRCVNIVRSRVGLPNLPAGLTKENFREAVITERACEFSWEEVRWFDLVRWKREDDFKKHLHGMNIYRSANPPYTYTYVPFEFPHRFWSDNWSPRWYLSAFPQMEINKGYGLVQNPGW